MTLVSVAIALTVPALLFGALLPSKVGGWIFLAYGVLGLTYAFGIYGTVASITILAVVVIFAWVETLYEQ